MDGCVGGLVHEGTVVRVWVAGWLCGWVSGWVHEWVAGWSGGLVNFCGCVMDVWVGGQVCAWMQLWLEECVCGGVGFGRWIGVWVVERVDGWLVGHGCMHGWICG